MCECANCVCSSTNSGMPISATIMCFAVIGILGYIMIKTTNFMFRGGK